MTVLVLNLAMIVIGLAITAFAVTLFFATRTASTGSMVLGVLLC